MKVTIAYLGTTTNASATFTTGEGTFPVTAATFRVSNLGNGRVVQWGLYRYEAKDGSLPTGTGFSTGARELLGVLAPRQSKTISVLTPWHLQGTWRAVFSFSKYGWRHRFQKLPPWGQNMVLRFVPESRLMASENWLTDTPRETVASPWIEVGGDGQ